MKKALGFGIGSAICIGAAWAYLRHISLPPGPDCSHFSQKVFGHRGCMNVPGIPENTLASFSYAKHNGADGVELDCRMAKDNCVVFHDAFLDPHLLCDDETKKVCDLTVNELRKYAYRDDTKGTERMPTLEDSILFCKEHSLYMLIEVKDLAHWKQVCEHLLIMYERYPDYMLKSTCVIAFHPAPLYVLRKKNPKIPVCILHSGGILQVWKSTQAQSGAFPFILKIYTPFWDWVLNSLQYYVASGVVGASMMGPKYTIVTEVMKRKWKKKNVLIYLWGQTYDEITPSMTEKGMLMTADSEYAKYVQKIKDHQAQRQKEQ